MSDETRLADDPDAELRGDTIFFSCPVDGCLVRLPVTRDPEKATNAPPVWLLSGHWPNVTLHPSVRIRTSSSGPDHWHGWLKDGVAK